MLDKCRWASRASSICALIYTAVTLPTRAADPRARWDGHITVTLSASVEPLTLGAFTDKYHRDETRPAPQPGRFPPPKLKEGLSPEKAFEMLDADISFTLESSELEPHIMLASRLFDVPEYCTFGGANWEEQKHPGVSAEVFVRIYADIFDHMTPSQIHTIVDAVDDNRDRHLNNTECQVLFGFSDIRRCDLQRRKNTWFLTLVPFDRFYLYACQICSRLPRRARRAQ